MKPQAKLTAPAVGKDAAVSPSCCSFEGLRTWNPSLPCAEGSQLTGPPREAALSVQLRPEAYELEHSYFLTLKAPAHEVAIILPSTGRPGVSPQGLRPEQLHRARTQRGLPLLQCCL